jgi:hypothetical protein
MTDTLLKPCPFCGHPAEHNNVNGNKLVKCTNQYCINTICTWPERVWNTRPIEDALQARIAELELILAADKLIEDGWIGRIEAGDKRIAELEAENAKLRASAVMWHKYPDEKPPDGTISFIVCYQIHYGVNVPMYGLATHYADGWREDDHDQCVVSNVYAWHEIPAIPTPPEEQ